MKKRIAGLGISLGLLLALSLVIVLPAIGCTLGGITGSATFQNEVFIGQTMDNPWWNTRHTLWVIQPEKGYKYLGTKAYIWGFWTGINEKGFSWAGSFIPTTDSGTPVGPGTVGKDEIGPMLLEKCETVYDAIDLLNTITFNETFSTRNAILADAQGNLALVEISYTKVNVETLTKDGYIYRANHFTSPEMIGMNVDPYSDVWNSWTRYNRGKAWFENWLATHKPIGKANNKMRIEDFLSPKDGYWSYVYEMFQNDKNWGPGTVGVMQPKKLTYWFNYGWPGGNLPQKSLELNQINQNMTWGAFIPFYLPELPPGQYTTELGQLTPLAIQYLFSHFTSKVQRTPAWVNYQSEDSLQPYYKPAEDIASPSGYTPKDNPFGPGGMIGIWGENIGFTPCPLNCP